MESCVASGSIVPPVSMDVINSGPSVKHEHTAKTAPSNLTKASNFVQEKRLLHIG